MADLGNNEIDIIFESTYDGIIAVSSNGLSRSLTRLLNG
jgi:hypothetical protein